MFNSFDECFNQYKDLCHKFAHKYFNLNLSGYDYDDRYSISLGGLYKAFKSYDNEKGVPFVSYASLIIGQEFNLIYRDLKAKKRQSGIILDLDMPTESGNGTLSDIIESDYMQSNQRVESLYCLLEEFKEESKLGEILYDYIYGVSVNEIANKHQYSRRYAYYKLEVAKNQFKEKLERSVYYGM